MEGLPLIPVLLPGIDKIPEDTNLLYLRQLNCVRFVQSIDEKEPLEELIQGITGIESPLSERYYNKDKTVLLVHQTKDEKFVI